ncbi:hypothetical protein JMN32_19290 [Fulvivirga sp. 29W222]|uniref:Signal transduction histidine kinase dimerisation/phosphoacceptor domain-containing protein n=1 Tax=Fulvivirga marina TaxID=2494733 RepID=A0A937G4V0_9BACT|nr:hypothetical protein [Fulvivirga marina]MBL6448466.1 hypothetical protein [Fulvivirga marina]
MKEGLDVLIRKILYNRSLSFKDNRIYRIFNIMLILAIIVVSLMGIFLISLGEALPFWLCIVEVMVFAVMLHYHIEGYFMTIRYIFFLFAISVQVYGSLYHGVNGGFDFYFLTTALSPILFFDKKRYYLSLFIISILTYITVKILYNYTVPVLPFETRQVLPYYLNIIISSILIYIGYAMFKSEHLKYEQMLREQRATLSAVKGQLEVLLQARTRKIEEHNQNMIKYAFLNSHKVRSPLARILGLVNLTKYEDLDGEDTRHFYLNELKVNAWELDKVLKEISQILNNHIDEAEPN